MLVKWCITFYHETRIAKRSIKDNARDDRISKRMLSVTTHENIVKGISQSAHYTIPSDCKELRMASLNYAEGQLVGTTVTAYVAGSSITMSRAPRSLFAE